MSEIIIRSMPSGASDAKRLASRLGVASTEIAIHRFPDGELGVTVAPTAPVTIIYAPLDRPNEKLLTYFARRRSLTPQWCQAARSGRALSLLHACGCRFSPGEAIGQKAIGRFLAGLMDRVITVDAHLHRTTDIHDVFPGIEADNLSAMPAIAAPFMAAGFDPRTVVVGPDAEPGHQSLMLRLALV